MSAATAVGKKRTVGDWLFDGANTILMIFVIVVMLYPFLYLLFYSLSDSGLIKPGQLLLRPVGFNADSYKQLIFSTKNQISNAFMISALRSTIGPVCSIFLTSLAAYVLTRTELVGRKVFLRYFVFTMYFESGMIPAYLLMRNLGLYNSFLVYIIPALFGVFNMILIKTYIENLPKGLEESALIDGANDFLLFRKIILPLIKPVLAATGLFACVAQWNAYADTMIYNTGVQSLYTLQYVLMTSIDTRVDDLRQAMEAGRTQRFNNQSLRMALTIVTMIPILCVYPFLQKYFAKGLLIGSIKG